MSVAAILPLLVGLGILVGLGAGMLLTQWVRASERTPAQEEMIRDEVAKRAARKAVHEALTRLR